MVRIKYDQPPAAQQYLATVMVQASADPVRVVQVRRERSDLLVRQTDPSEPEPDRIPIFDGE